MKKISTIAVTMLLMACSQPPTFTPHRRITQVPGHPIFTRCRAPLSTREHKLFDERDFIMGKGKTIHVEGELWWLTYYPYNDLKSKPSELQIRRNFENAIKKLGGTFVGKATNNKQIFKLVKDGKEIWVELWAEFTGKYGFTIIQKGEKDVVANAEVFQTT